MQKFISTQYSGDPDNEGYGVEAIKALDLVIMGAESGPGARRMGLAWAEDIAQQCREAGTPLFYKQGPGDWDDEADRTGRGYYGKMPTLLGRVWDEWPT